MAKIPAKAPHIAFKDAHLEPWHGPHGSMGMKAYVQPDGLRARHVRYHIPGGDKNAANVKRLLVVSDGQNAMEPGPYGNVEWHLAPNHQGGEPTAVVAIDHGEDDRLEEFGDYSPGGKGGLYTQFSREVVSAFLERFQAMREGLVAATGGSSMGGVMSTHQLFVEPHADAEESLQYTVGVVLSPAFRHSEQFRDGRGLRDHVTPHLHEARDLRFLHMDAGAHAEDGNPAHWMGRVASFMEASGFDVRHWEWVSATIEGANQALPPEIVGPERHTVATSLLHDKRTMRRRDQADHNEFGFKHRLLRAFSEVGPLGPGMRNALAQLRA